MRADFCCPRCEDSAVFRLIGTAAELYHCAKCGESIEEPPRRCPA